MVFYALYYFHHFLKLHKLRFVEVILLEAFDLYSLRCVAVVSNAYFEFVNSFKERKKTEMNHRYTILFFISFFKSLEFINIFILLKMFTLLIDKFILTSSLRNFYIIR